MLHQDMRDGWVSLYCTYLYQVASCRKYTYDGMPFTFIFYYFVEKIAPILNIYEMRVLCLDHLFSCKICRKCPVIITEMQ